MFYAKSLPKETIREHTDNLYIRYKKLYELYKNKFSCMREKDWELLELAVKYHDVGKADPVFQNKIRKVLKEKTLEHDNSISVQHNYLSALAIPYRKLSLAEEESYILALSVGYHHERNAFPNREELLESYKKNIVPLIEDIENHMGIEVPKRPRTIVVEWLNKRIKPSKKDLFLRYAMIKGLLHRLDHAASAHVDVELATDYFVDDFTNKFFAEKLKKPKRPLQVFAEENQNNHLLAIAQTGMGKTEAGLLWIGKDKGFFTLPLRTSINAMYKRIRDPKEGIGFTSKLREPEEEEKAIGLIHSTSLDYLYELEEETGENDRQLELVYEQSRHFANKLIISTIDQILKFPLFYRGFEKEMAMMAGAKVVIDEMQSYNPRIAALIIRALQLIDELGGKFMIMTATMPDLYIKALEKQLGKPKTPLIKKEFYDDSVKRHCIKLHDYSILDAKNEILKTGMNKKVLVICNTVKRAKEVYEKLTEDPYSQPINLLHSKFIRRDRAKKESDLINFANGEDSKGIWITTQLVEASLDIDFDVLYTEMSTLDSLFQRFGRCNRKGLKSINGPNVHIFIDDVSGVGKNSVYHPEIYERSLSILKEEDENIVLESKKMAMIEKLYDANELEGTSFKEEFIDTLKELNNMPPYEIDKKEAQYLLREIRQIQVIPRSIFEEEAQILFEKYEQEKDKNNRRKIRREINQLTVGVNKWAVENKGILSKSGIPDAFKELYILDCKYSDKTGTELDKEIDPFS